MTGIATAAVSSIVSGVVSSRSANRAADAQVEGTEIATKEQRRQFDAIQKLLAPYIEPSIPALEGQKNLLGLGGADKEALAIKSIMDSPTYRTMLQEGEAGILQNASATGGLRGGNVQEALARFRPELLTQLIESKYNKLGGLVNLGQASAVGEATAGQNAANNISNLAMERGSAIAGKYLARGDAINQVTGAIGQLGTLKLLGAF